MCSGNTRGIKHLAVSIEQMNLSPGKKPEKGNTDTIHLL
jgi:hypothetical protein